MVFSVGHGNRACKCSVPAKPPLQTHPRCRWVSTRGDARAADDETALARLYAGRALALEGEGQFQQALDDYETALGRAEAAGCAAAALATSLRASFHSPSGHAAACFFTSVLSCSLLLTLSVLLRVLLLISPAACVGPVESWVS